MAEAGDDAEAAADRLEAALERIAALAVHPLPAAPPESESLSALPEVSQRLDALIAHLRQALDGPPAGQASGPPPQG